MKKLLFIFTLLASLCQAQQITLLPLQASAPEVMAPQLPDISKYNLQWVKKHLPKDNMPPQINVEKIFDITEFQHFTNGVRAMEWVKRQTGFPQAIVVRDGVARLSDIAETIDPLYFELKSDGTYISRLPIVVTHGATLIISKDTEASKLLLSQTKGAFILNAGSLFIIESQIIGWNEIKNEPAYYVYKKNFRPFITGQGKSETYLASSTFKQLGYSQAKSYGISLTGVPEQYKEVVHGNPNGWFIDNLFEDIYYGFYSHEAEDSVILGNTYYDNIVYAIDPHDYSKRLIIARNTTYKTRERHGIIVSRGVEDSWIFNNKSYENARHGIVLDRQSKNNIIAYNHSYNNKGDGITLFESPDVLIYGNVVSNNGKHGVRVRNSQNVISAKNVIKNNGQLAFYIYTSDPNGKERDLVLDPYVKKVSFSTIGDYVLENKSGVLSGEKVHPLLISGMVIKATDGASTPLFGGGYAPYNTEILQGLLNHKQAIRFSDKEQ